jgi:predicted PurR-regulated permease PerM
LAVVIIGFVLCVIGVYLIRNVLAIAALAALIAFLVAPLIRLAHDKLHMPRGLALIIAYLFVFAATLSFGYLITDSIVESIIELDPIGQVNEWRLWLLGEIDSDNYFRIFGLTIDMTAVMDDLRSPVASGGDGSGVIDIETIIGYAGASLAGFRTVAGFIAAAVTSAIVTVLVAMYLNADSERFHVATVEHMPPGYERDGWLMMKRQKRVWTGYLYGQLVNSLITPGSSTESVPAPAVVIPPTPARVTIATSTTPRRALRIRTIIDRSPVLAATRTAAFLPAAGTEVPSGQLLRGVGSGTLAISRAVSSRRGRASWPPCPPS